MDYQYLRTINLRFVVPWYDAIPQIGAVLVMAGWWNRRGKNLGKGSEAPRSSAPTQLEWVGVCLLVVLMIGLNRPRVDRLVRATVGSLQPSDRKIFKIEELQTMRANVLLLDRTRWQRRHLIRLDQCEAKASQMGWGRDAIRAAFGNRFIPGLGEHLPAGKYNDYDAAALLDLPDEGDPVDPRAVRAVLAELYAVEREPRPIWLYPNEKWPPPQEEVRTSE
jgi:hypothetical protein